ncbi:MAG: J domain-containing protein [Anaerolineae bacterium]|nr:J domain-containing protein [Anaerolineae bacterium]
MSCYGFNFRALYRLDLEELLEVAQLIRGKQGIAGLARDKDVVIRGCIIPFLRKAAKVPKAASKDEVMRQALIRVAKHLKVEDVDWNQATTESIKLRVRRAFDELLQRQLDKLSEDERARVLAEARRELAKGAAGLGISLAGGGAVIAGEMSGFGIYLATTTGLKALSFALGTTFSWGIYQGATTLLGVILGPVGWAIAGTSVLVTGAAAFNKWLKQRDSKLNLVVISLILALGENPFAFFGLTCGVPLQEVKTAYRAMMKTFHPDKIEPGLPQWVKDDFGEKLLRAQEAYNRILNLQEENNGA